MLTTAVGPFLTKQMHEVLDLMLPWGLSDALYHALDVIANHIPPLLRVIQGEPGLARLALATLNTCREAARHAVDDLDRSAVPAIRRTTVHTESARREPRRHGASGRSTCQAVNR